MLYDIHASHELQSSYDAWNIIYYTKFMKMLISYRFAILFLHRPNIEVVFLIARYAPEWQDSIAI